MNKSSSGEMAAHQFVKTRLAHNAPLLKERGAADWQYHKGWHDALMLIFRYLEAVGDITDAEDLERSDQ